MSTVHQIYCTHCTHGSSALERREGELAARTLGYSARAGSLESHLLRKSYRQIERYVYYYLPRDTPAEEKLRLTAASAPRRLVFYPSTGGLQIVAQICYRPTDTQGRPGSYFAHVLFREENNGSPRWSPLECLKLWRAPGWTDEDAPEIPFLLPPLGSLEEMHGGQRPAVDDAVLLSFLSTPPGGSFDDPAGTIPERWRQVDAGRRRDLLIHALGGFLEVTGPRREPLLLVVEPGVAALVFYGVLRLLPAGAMRDRISFSTFEPNTDRLTTSLAGTWFFDPAKTDLRPDAYRSRGFAIHTVSGRRSESRRPGAPYAPMIVGRLLDEGWEAVDWTLATLRSVGAGRPEDLDALAAVDRSVPALLDPRHASLSQDWRRSAMATGYLRRALRWYLSRMKDPTASLKPIVGRPAHLLILELLMGEPQAPGTLAIVEFLLRNLPGDRIADLLKHEAIPSEAKIDVLARYVTTHTDLPAGCDDLWDEPAEAPASPAPAAEPLLPRLLRRLDAKTLEQFYARVAGQHSDAFLVGLLSACRRQPSTQIALTRIVEKMDPKAVLSLFRSHGPALLAEYPEDEPALGARLREMLASLARYPRQFPQRLDLILAGRHRLPEADQDLAATWANCRQAILEVGSLQAQKSGILRQPPLERLEAAAQTMARAAAKAMPSDRFDDDAKGSRKQKCLRLIGQRLLDGKPLLPPGAWYHQALWQKIAWHFENGKWPSVPLRKMAPRSRSLKSNWTLLAGIVAGVFLAVLIGLLSLLGGPRSESGDAAATSDSRTPRASHAAAAGAAKHPEASRKTTERDLADRAPARGPIVRKTANKPPPAFQTEPQETFETQEAETERLVDEPPEEPIQRPPKEKPNEAAASETGPLPAEKQIPAEYPKREPAPAPQTAASIDGRVEATARPVPALRPPVIAQVKPRVTGKSGAPLPSWLREELVTDCLVIAQDSVGLLSRPTELRDIEKGPVVDVVAGTVAVSVRFTFVPRSTGPSDQQEKAVAATRWYMIERVEAGNQYTIHLELSPAELDWLRLLAEGAGADGR